MRCFCHSCWALLWSGPKSSRTSYRAEAPPAEPPFFSSISAPSHHSSLSLPWADSGPSNRTGGRFQGPGAFRSSHLGVIQERAAWLRVDGVG